MCRLSLELYDSCGWYLYMETFVNTCSNHAEATRDTKYPSAAGSFGRFGRSTLRRPVSNDLHPCHLLPFACLLLLSAMGLFHHHNEGSSFADGIDLVSDPVTVSLTNTGGRVQKARTHTSPSMRVDRRRSTRLNSLTKQYQVSLILKKS